MHKISSLMFCAFYILIIIGILLFCRNKRNYNRGVQFMTKNSIGSIVRTRRKELGLTQAQLAEKINSDVYYVSKIETGKRKPGGKFLVALSNALEISVDTLLGVESNIVLREQVSTLEEKLQTLSEKDRLLVLEITEQLIERLSSDG